MRRITRRTRFSRLAPLDVALLSGSIMCLNALVRFLIAREREDLVDEPMSQLVMAMLQASADVRLGIETAQTLTKVIQQFRNPLHLPFAIWEAGRDYARSPDTEPILAHAYYTTKIAHTLDCHEIPGYGPLESMTDR